MKVNFFILVLAIMLGSNIVAQEWEPQTHITGYLNTMVEYADIDTLRYKSGIGLAEAAFLASYKPLENLEIKTTLVYTHHIEDLQSLVVEAFGIYSFSDAFKVGAGKFLTPLSPVNTYFYAPLNTTVSLPMLVSHHFILPQSISGLQLSGQFGSDLVLKYNATYGNYLNLGHPKYGILGIQGQEEVTPMANTSTFQPQYLLGGSARVEASYNGMVSLGLNYFDGTKSTQIVPSPTGTGVVFVDASKYSFGIDAHVDIAGFKLNGEYWQGEQKTKDFTPEIKSEYKGYYVEAMYEIGIVTPFFRYDFVEDVKSPLLEAPTTGISFGASIRPTYETLFKLEYRSVGIDYDGLAVSNVDLQDKYKHVLISFVYSF